MSGFDLRSLIKISHNVFDLSDGKTIIQLRWIVILASCSLMLFANNNAAVRNLAYPFVAFHVLTNASLYFISAARVTSGRFFSFLLIFDTVVLSLALIVTGNLGSDFYLTYFLIIIIAAFWQDMRWSLAFAVIICLLYSALLLLGERYETELLLRVPFLFVASVFYGYFTQLLHSERSLREKAEREARVDFLTGLPNRKAFDERIREESERIARYGRALSLLMIDIDNFKTVNDTLGHEWGDHVLRLISGVLRRNMRQSDFVARYGGEEFAVILPETELENALHFGERTRLAVRQTPIDTPKGLLVVTVSIGASSKGGLSGDLLELDRQADQALYLAKQRGKDRVECLLNSDSMGGNDGLVTTEPINKHNL